MLGRVSLGALLVGLAWFSLGCGGGAVPDAGLAGEVRVLVRSIGDESIAVGLELRGASRATYERAMPESNRVRVEGATGAWWHSSELAIDALGVVLVGTGADGFGVVGTDRRVFDTGCRYFYIEPGANARLMFSAATGQNCDAGTESIQVGPSESKPLRLRVALRIDDGCAELRLDVRSRASGRADWRSLPAGSVCELDHATGWRAGRLLAVPYQEQGELLEVRLIGNRVSAAIDGVLLPTPCGWLTLFHGFRSVWQLELDPADCEADWTPLRWLMWVGHPPAPDDPADRQQLHVYDWEWEVEANYLPANWLELITGLHARRIVRAVYQDYYGDTATPPDVRRAAPDSEFSGAYDPESHTIFLIPQQMSAGLILHETVHAMLRVSAELDPALRYHLITRHGPVFVARLIEVWARYTDDLDVDAIRAAAEWHGVSIGETPLLGPRGGEAERQAVIEAIRGK